MSIFDFFLPRRQPTAAIAKERLQIVLAHERAGRDGPDFLPMLQKELLAVVGKYVLVKEDMIRVNLGKSDGTSVLEINVEFDGAAVKARTAAIAAKEAIAKDREQAAARDKEAAKDAEKGKGKPDKGAKAMGAS